MYEFEIKISSRDSNFDPESYIDQLYEGGCDDALICYGDKSMAFIFGREGKTFSDALFTAMEDIKEVIPLVVIEEIIPLTGQYNDRIKDISDREVQQKFTDEVLPQVREANRKVFELWSNTWNLSSRDNCCECVPGRLQPMATKHEMFAYWYVRLFVYNFHSVCDFCGAEMASGWEVNLNAQVSREVKKIVDTFLTGNK